jgi:hypothetical protein
VVECGGGGGVWWSKGAEGALINIHTVRVSEGVVINIHTMRRSDGGVTVRKGALIN